MKKNSISKHRKSVITLLASTDPVHFRPHYHVILWFDDDELYKVIRQILYKSWKFGRIDCQKVHRQLR